VVLDPSSGLCTIWPTLISLPALEALISICMFFGKVVSNVVDEVDGALFDTVLVKRRIGATKDLSALIINLRLFNLTSGT